MTWHQWHQTVPRSSSTKRPSLLAWEKTDSDHGCHLIPLSSANALVKGSSTKANRMDRLRHIVHLPAIDSADRPARGSGRTKVLPPITRFNSASIENKPGPNANTINAVSRKRNGSAFTNLSGSLKMLFTASGSPVTSATHIEITIISAIGRDARPTIKRRPP